MGDDNNERLARIETKLEVICEDIAEIKDYIKVKSQDCPLCKMDTIKRITDLRESTLAETNSIRLKLYILAALIGGATGLGATFLKGLL